MLTVENLKLLLCLENDSKNKLLELIIEKHQDCNLRGITVGLFD